MSEHIAINRRHWDERAPVHAASPDYGFEAFVRDPQRISTIVAFDRPRLGDVSGLHGLHLQCHIGSDTLSLARLGATMSGLDFSPPSLAQARRLAELTGTEIDYRAADAYDAVDVFGAGAFDLVYTGIGALCWLPSITRWAEVVAALLRPGGRLFIREGHPMLWALDETTDPPVLGYPYFETEDATTFDEPGTYVSTDATLTENLTLTWNHGIGEIVTALLDNGMRLTQLVEHDSVPWEALPGHMVVDDAGEWRLRDRPDRLAATYTLQAVKQLE